MESIICPKCNIRNRRNKGRKPNGKIIYSKFCQQCMDTPEKIAHRNKLAAVRKDPYKAHKKDYCEKCGFVAVRPCQLDVDHIDGNHKNNNIDNLQTLCANCHRLKTYENKEWAKAYR